MPKYLVLHSAIQTVDAEKDNLARKDDVIDESVIPEYVERYLKIGAIQIVEETKTAAPPNKKKEDDPKK